MGGCVVHRHEVSMSHGQKKASGQGVDCALGNTYRMGFSMCRRTRKKLNVNTGDSV